MPFFFFFFCLAPGERSAKDLKYCPLPPTPQTTYIQPRLDPPRVVKISHEDPSQVEIWIKPKNLENGVGEKKKIGWVGWGGRGEIAILYKKKNVQRAPPPRRLMKKSKRLLAVKMFLSSSKSLPRKGKEKKRISKKNIEYPRCALKYPESQIIVPLRPYI